MTLNLLITVFFVTLLIFHIPVLFKWETKKFWTGIDYLWIFLSSIGILSMYKDASNTINRNKNNYYEKQIVNDYKNLLENLRDFKERTPLSEIIKDSSVYIKRGDYSYIKEVANYYEDFLDLMEKEYSTIIIEKEYYKIARISEWLKSKPDKFQTIKHAKGMWYPTYKEEIQFIEDSYKNLNISQALIEESDKEKFLLKYFGPLFLAVGVGIRMAKVSAQLRGIA